jgi:radical SAM superfamily enzyme YgiQ (UPF0313 family)
MPPLGLACLAAVLQQAGHEIRTTDAIVEGWDRFMPYGRLVARGLHNRDISARVEPNTDVVGIGIMSSVCWPLVIDLCERLKKAHPGIFIVLGGEHPTALPEFCLRTSRADAVVLGEGELTIVDLVRAYENGGVAALGGVPGIAYLEGETFFVTAPRPRMRDLDRLPFPAWHLFDVDLYQKKRFIGASLGTGRRALPILASRGCPHRCTFCTAETMWGRTYVTRTPRSVVDEMEYLGHRHDVTDFTFCDLTLGLRRDWLEQLANEILDRRLDVVWQMTTRLEVMDDMLAGLLHRAGLRYVCLAPESASRNTRNRIGKIMTAADIDRAVWACVRAGISTRVQIMSGLPGDTYADTLANVIMAARLGYRGVDGLGTAVFAPYPGTELFRQLVESGEIDIGDELFEFTVDNNQFVKPLLKSQRLSPYATKASQFLVLGTFLGARMFSHPLHGLGALRRAFYPDTYEHDYFEKMLRIVLVIPGNLAASPCNSEPIPWPVIDYRRFAKSGSQR